MNPERKSLKRDKIYYLWMEMKRFNIVEKSHLRVLIAGILVIASAIFFGMTAKYSEEFTGWISVSFTYDKDVSQVEEKLWLFLEDQGYDNSHVYLDQKDTDLTIKISADLVSASGSGDKTTELKNSLETFLISEGMIRSSEDLESETSIGPSVWDYMKSTAKKALIAGIILMAIYVLFAFGKIRKEIPAEVLVSTVVCVLIFDICATLGVYALWMKLNPTVQVNTIFVTALLTIIAYGINDVIVIFDRIRENIIRSAKEKNVNISNIVEESVWQTMRRSIGTSVSTILVLIGMYVFASWAEVLQQFAFTVWMGIIVSTWASIFLGSSCTNLFMKLLKKKK